MIKFKKTAISLTLFILVSCSTNDIFIVEPLQTPFQVKSLTFFSSNEKNLMYLSYNWKDGILSSYEIKTLNIKTNKDYIHTYGFTRNANNLIQEISFTSLGGNSPDGSEYRNYAYTSENTQIYHYGTTWNYNRLGNLVSIQYGVRLNAGTVEFEYNSSNQLVKLHQKEGNYLDKKNTLSQFSNIENPLYKIAKNTQFLNLTIFDIDMILGCSPFIPKSYYNGVDENNITYDLDSQKRVNSISVSNNETILRKYTFVY